MARLGEGLFANEASFIEALVSRMLRGTLVARGMQFCFSLSGISYKFRIETMAPASGADGKHRILGRVDGDTHCALLASPSSERRTSSFLAANSTAEGVGEISAVHPSLAHASGTSTVGESSRFVQRARQRGHVLGEGGYESLGGLRKEIALLQRVVTLPWRKGEAFAAMGLHAPKGVILHGPPGTGKSRLAYAVAGDAGAALYVINGPDLVSEVQGESEASLQALFQDARANEPAVIVIDEIDAIAPSREATQQLVTNSGFAARLTAELLTLMDHGKATRERVVVIAATNRIEALDHALRRPGRFDYEIEVGVPGPSDRREIMQVLLRGMAHALDAAAVEGLAKAAHGFTGADLKAMCNEASMCALRRLAGAAEGVGPMDRTGEGVAVLPEDFAKARRMIVPSAMREVAFEAPDVRWEDIGGRRGLKQKLKDIIRMQTHEMRFDALNVQALRGVLLYGPPGCSKTMLVKAVAAQSGLNFINVKGPELLSKYVGESEKAIKTLFARAKAAAPAVVFIDEVDGLAGARDGDTALSDKRVLTQLLIEMDNVGSNRGVAVIGATNRPDRMDLALLRPGRFDWLLYVPPPDCAERQDIVACLLRRTPVEEGAAVVAERVAGRTEGMSAADLHAVVRKAALFAIEHEGGDVERIGWAHLERSLATTPASLATMDASLVSMYERFGRGSGAPSAS